MKPIVKLFQYLIQAYRLLLSPWLGNRCRFTPSCSEYTQQAIEHHGLFKGAVLSVKRISRCHPLGASGYDPVPEKSGSHCCAAKHPTST